MGWCVHGVVWGGVGGSGRRSRCMRTMGAASNAADLRTPLTSKKREGFTCTQSWLTLTLSPCHHGAGAPCAPSRCRHHHRLWAATLLLAGFPLVVPPVQPQRRSLQPQRCQRCPGEGARLSRRAGGRGSACPGVLGRVGTRRRARFHSTWDTSVHTWGDHATNTRRH